MANRYMEFQEKVKFILDKSDVKKDVQEFADEVQDVFKNVKVGLDSSSLKQLGDLFNEKLKELGKTPIVFSDIEIGDSALKEITTRFTNAIGDGIRAGVKVGVDDALAEIARLEKSKAPHIDKKKELTNAHKRLSSAISARNDKDYIHPQKLAKEDDINKQARKIYQEFVDAKSALVNLYEDMSVSDADYQKAEDHFYQSIDNLYRMRQTMKDYMSEVTDKAIKKKFKFDNLNFAVDEAFAEVDLPSLDDSDSQLAKYEDAIANIDKILVSIDNRIKEIKNSNQELFSEEMTKRALKSLDEVDDALDRIRNKTKKKEVNKNKLAAIVSARDYDPAAENNKNILATLSKGLSTARQDGAGWEEEYQWIVKFVKQYKYLQDNGGLSKHLQQQYEPLFNELVGIADNAETSLRKLVDRAEGKLQQEDVGDNAEKLRIEEEKKLAAENQAKAAADAASAAEREGETKKETLKIEEKRLAIMKELAKYGTLKDAMSAGGKKIDFNGETVHFGSMVSDYMDEALGQSFSREAYEKLWKEARVEFGPKFEPVEITKEDAIAIIREKVPDNILDGWFRDGDSSYKAKLEQLAMSDDDIRNAALNIMWSNFKEFSGKDIGFAEFLQSEISMYRGKNHENYVDGDETIAFTFDKKVAEGFGKYVLETLVKPIETLGAYQTTGESESLVYRDKLENRPEYQQWHAEMNGGAETDATARLAEEERKANEDAEARAKAEKEAADEIDRQKRSLEKIGDTYKKNILPGVTKEISAQLDSKSGDFNRLVIGDATQVEDHNNFVTDYDSFNGKYKEHYDTDYHTHPTDVAAPSMKDLARYQQSSNSGYQQLAVIQAMKEALFLDFSSLNSTAMKEMVAEYGSKSAQIQQEFLAKYGEDKDPTSENNQKLAVALKNAFLEVAQKHPGVATYVDHEMPRYDSYYDRYEELPENARQLIKEIAALYSEPDDDKKDWNAIDEKEAKLASLDAGMGRAVGTEQWIDLTDRISAEMAARQESIDSIQKEITSRNELSNSTESKIPSEEDIKSGKASWRGVPIQYDSSLSGEARNLTDFMKVGPKFFGMDEDAQKSILDHEVAHNIADRIMNQATDEWEKVADIFAPKKLLPKGANPSFYTEEDDEGNRWYREGLYGDLGATALSETLTHSLTEYFSNPDAFKNRSEGAFNYLEEYLNKSGDNLDNAAVGAVKEELAAQEELNAAKQEEQRIDQESAAARAEASLDKLDELSDKAYDETDADALNKILQERKAILDSIDESVRPDYAEEIESHKQINAELEKRLSLLIDAQNGLIDVDDIDDIIKETGTLESKLERLDDVSYDWGMKIKDGEEDDAIDELEAFEETYDRIVLKLANGKKIEILPNAKGLRQLNKYQDGLDHSAYGETEIDDVIFERKKKEIAIQERLNDVKQEEQRIEQADSAHEVVSDNQKKIQSYEELKQALQEYYDAMSQVKRIENTSEDLKWNALTSDISIGDGTDVNKEFQTQWKRVAAIKKSVKDGADAYIDPEDKTAYRINENTLDEEMRKLQGIAAEYRLDFEQLTEKQRKFVDKISTAYDRWMADYDRRLDELNVVNKPHEDKAFNIESSIGKQLQNQDISSYSSFTSALSDVQKYGVTEQSLKVIGSLIGIEIPQAATTAKQAVDGLNTSLEKQHQIERADASATQAADEQAETVAIQKQNEALKENLSLKQMVENADGAHGQSLASANGTVSGKADEVVGANMQGLQNILSAITYNVKIVNDDTDKMANKIALDDSSLEATLNRVFASILNPITEQNDGNAQGPWALESTLKAVKGVLDTIQTNTAKIGNIQNLTTAAQTQQFDVNDVGNTLKFIESAVNSIKNKIGKEKPSTSKDKSTSGTDKPGAQNSSKSSNVKPAKSDSRVKELQALYKQRGTLMAQYSFNHSDETAEEINKLNEKIKLKMKELYIEEARRGVLKKSLMEMQEEAKESEKAVILAEKAAQAAKAEKEARKQAAQDEKAELKARMKRDREENRVGASTSAWNAGNKALESLWKIDNKDKPLEQKSVQDLMASLKELNDVRQRVNDSLRKGIEISEADSDELKRKTAQVAQHTEAVKLLVKNYDDLSGNNAKETGHIFDGGDLEANLKNVAREITNGQAKIGDFDAATGRLKYTVKTGAYEFEEYEMAVREVGGAIVSLQKGTKRTETFLEGFKRKLSEITRYFSASSLIFKFFNEFKKGIQYVREIDSALTELKKVTDETEETYDKFLDTAAKTADKVGSTIKDVVSSTADWARLGYSMKEAAKFAESTQILMNVSEFTDVSRATDTLISSVQAFGYTAETSMDVVDLLNTIGNNYAISTADLAQSLTKSSASLVAAGGDLAEAAALTATANKIIQDADSVGTALKTTSLRLRGTDAKILEEEGLDSEGAVTSKSKLQGKVKALSGVDILTATGEYKSTYEILSQIADVWENINDMDQAALLELISGKRNSSVIAAILQNPRELKEAYEDAMKAEGSALKENEKYLDSIQGKIDQFNNALQTMWSNVLDDDVVKWFVDIATQLVKILDKLGPIKTLVAGIAVYLNKKYNFVDFSNLFAGFKEAFSNSKGPKDFFKNLISGFKNTETSSEDLIAAQNKLQVAQNRLANTKSTNPKTIQKYEREVKKAKLEVDNLTAAQKKSGKTGNTAFTGLGKSVKKFGKQVASVITQMLIMWAITKVIELISKGFDNLITTAEEAAEAYDELNAELDTLKDNLDDIKNEISEIDDRMAELIAKGSLSFTEKEELERLRAEREELERTLELNQQLANQKQQQVNNQTSDQVAYYRNKGVKSGKTTGEHAGSGALTGMGVGAGVALATGAASAIGSAALGAKAGAALGTLAGPIGTAIGLAIGAGIGAAVGAGIGAGIGASEEKVGDSIENMEENLAKKEEEVAKAREKYQKSGKDKDREKYEEAQKALSDYRGEMAQYFTEIDAMYQNVDLSTIEDPDEYKRLKKEMNDFYNERDKWLITSGAEGAESNAIERIFSKDDYENASNTIDNLVKKLEKDPTDQSVINQISEQCKLAEKDLEAVGLSVQDAKDYFTMLGQNAAFDTLEGKTAEMALATSKLQTLLSNTKSADFMGLFGQGGEISETAIAEYFQGTSEATRKEIARLVKDINDGKISVENALKQFELFGIQSAIDIHITEVKTNFKDIFVELEDADGLIDTFEELGEAIGSTADALKVFNKAEAEMANSGRVSIETALQLMEYTDDYGSILQVVDGKLQLVDNAEEVLIQTRIDAIKTSAQASLSDAASAYEKAKLATQTYRDALTTDMSAKVVANAWEKVLAAAAGLWEGIKSLLTDESWTDAYNRGYNETLSNITGYETEYTDEGLQALVDAENEAKEAYDAANDRVELTNQLTSDTIGDLYDSDDVDTKEDAENKAFQKAMDYWENRISANQAKYNQIQNEIDLLEAKGMRAGEEYYREQIELENQRKSLLENQKAEALTYLATLEEGSDEWWEVANTINDIEGELDDVIASVHELNNAVGQIRWDTFEEVHDRFSNLTSDLENIRDILSNEDMFDDEGNWTEEGVATLATYLQELEIYKGALDEVQDQLKDFQGGYTGREDYFASIGIDSEQEYYDKLVELTDKQDDYVKVIKESEQSVVEMYENQIDAVEEYIGELIDGYNDYIDVVKESLDAERDLYEFKKKIKDQTKDIASLERRVASLSGSTNASDIAERRKLEAELLEAKEGLNDTYYDHSKDQQSQALDEEAQAYEDAMNNYVEGLRTSLDEATKTMTAFMTAVTSSVMQNADTVKTEYINTGAAIDSALITPWDNVIAKMSYYEENSLSKMNAWTTEDGFFGKFNIGATNLLESPWSAGIDAANSFKADVGKTLDDVVAKVESNVETASNKLSQLYNQILDTEKKQNEVTQKSPTQKVADTAKQVVNTVTSAAKAAINKYITKDVSVGSDIYYDSKGGKYYKLKGYINAYVPEGSTTLKGKSRYAVEGSYYYTQGDKNLTKNPTVKQKNGQTISMYAKGTMGTKRDELALTDELGDELVLVPGPNGNLSFMRKGTSVVPADITANLVEWGKLNPNMLNVGGGANINMISNAINKPEINLDIAEFLHVDKVDKDTMPELEKFVDKKMNDLVRQLNYSIKKFK